MITWLQNFFGGRDKSLETMPRVDTKIELYKTDWCPHCKTAARIIAQFNATNIHIYDVEKQPERGHEMFKRTNGRTSIPQIFIGDKHVGGASDLMRAVQTGQIKELLGLGVVEATQKS